MTATAAHGATPVDAPALSLVDAAGAAGGGMGLGGEVRFILNGAVFEGSQTLTAAELESAWASYRGKPVSLADLREIARRAEALYVRSGRPFVAVSVPPQDAANGIVRFSVLEGRVSNLTILGSDPVARRQAAAAFAQLTEGGAASPGVLDEVFGNARRIPGLTVTGTLRRGETPGEMDLVVQARRKPWRVYLNVNNLIGDSVGPWGAMASVQYAGESLYGDLTTLQLYTTADGHGERVARLMHERRINAAGTSLSGQVTIGDAEPSGGVAPGTLAAKLFQAKLAVTQPVLNRGPLSLGVGAGLEWNDQETRVTGLPNLAEDHLRIVTLRATLTYDGPLGRADAYAEARKGVDFGNASQITDAGLSRVGGDPQALVWRGGLNAVTAPVGPLTLALKVEGQTTEDLLLASEQYSAGNFSIGRGFAPGAIFGDRAIAGSIEARVMLFKYKDVRFSPFAFYDAAQVWSDGPIGGGRLSSVGGGLRAEVPGRIRMDLYYAHPETFSFSGSGGGSPTILFTLTASLDGLRRGGGSSAR